MTRIRSLAPRILVALCLAATGLLHADLYLNGYRAIPVIGVAFEWQAAASVALAVLLPIAYPVVLRLAAAALSAGALGAFVLSRTTGLVGFTEYGWQPAPQAALTVLAESAALVGLALPLLRWARTRKQVGVSDPQSQATGSRSIP